MGIDQRGSGKIFFLMCVSQRNNKNFVEKKKKTSYKIKECKMFSTELDKWAKTLILTMSQ